MKFLLDENFPLQLYRYLLDAGHEAEHIIALGQRGAADLALRERLAVEELVFLTHDTEFEDLPLRFRSRVIVSQLPQRLPIAERVEIWSRALERFVRDDPAESLFNLLPTGEIVAWAVEESPDGVTIRRSTRRI